MAPRSSQPLVLHDVKAKWVLYDLYGLALESGLGEVVAIRALVKAAVSLDLSDRAFRTAADRLVRLGQLSVTRVGRRSLYRLTSRGWMLIQDARRRMFSPYEADWDGQWCVVGLSVPETERDVRDRMRIRLSWLGFGSPSTGFYLSPRDHFDEVRRLTDDLGAGAYVHMYRGEIVLPTDLHDLVARAWSTLESINQRYSSFVDQFADHYRRAAAMVRAESLSAHAAFRTRIILENEFRKCLFDDPRLPESLMPPSWKGPQARDLFVAYQALVTPLAQEYLAQLCREAIPRRSSDTVPPPPLQLPRRTRVTRVKGSRRLAPR